MRIIVILFLAATISSCCVCKGGQRPEIKPGQVWGFNYKNGKYTHRDSVVNLYRRDVIFRRNGGAIRAVNKHVFLIGNTLIN